MRNIHSLNHLLSNISTAQQLIDAYKREVGPRSGRLDKGSEVTRDDLNYCSGAAAFVITYLTERKDLYSKMEEEIYKEPLHNKTVAELFVQVKAILVPYVGLLNAQSYSHVCVLAR